MAHPVSSRVQDSSSINMLSALQTSKVDATSSNDFSRALENSVRNHDRPAPSRPEQTPPREASRNEARRPTETADSAEPVRQNRAESRPADHADSQASSDKTTDTQSTAASPSEKETPAAKESSANAQTPTPVVSTTTANEEPVATKDVEIIAAAEEAETEIVPANLAALAAIIAALDKVTSRQAGATTEADGDGELVGSTLRSPGSVLGELLEKSAGKGGEGAGQGTGQGSEKDKTNALAADTRQAKLDTSTLSASFTRVLATLDQPLTPTYSAPAATGLQALSADAAASPGALPNSFVPGLRAETSNLPQLQVHTPAGQRAWAEDVGQRVMFMVGRGDSRAELVLTPPSLGKLSVSIQVSGDQTTAQFVAASSAARDMLEQAMPRLREVLQQAGINLGQTDVSTSGEQHTAAQGEQRNGHGSSSRQRDGSGLRSGEMDVELAPPQRWTRATAGLVDTFA